MVDKEQKFQEGRRYLVQNMSWQLSQDLFEVTVLEISPGGYIKFEFITGGIRWDKAERYRIFEELKTIQTTKV